MGREITAIFRMGTFWMLARGRVKWLTVGSRQYSGRSREEKADEEGEGRSGEEEGELLERKGQGTGGLFDADNKSMNVNKFSDGTRLFIAASHIEPNRSDSPVRLYGK